MDEADRLRDEILREIREAASPEALETIRVAALGRRGRLTELMRGLGALAPEARREAGAALNAAKDEITTALAEAGERLGRAARATQLVGERADVTLPVQAGEPGRIHPISQTIDEIIAIFGEMGFVVAEGPQHVGELVAIPGLRRGRLWPMRRTNASRRHCTKACWSSWKHCAASSVGSRSSKSRLSLGAAAIRPAGT